METPARLRLYQYPESPFCIPIALALRHSGIPHDVVDLPPYDPSQVIKLTEGKYYQVPVLEDLFSHLVIYDQGNEEVARYIHEMAPLMQLFPGEVEGLQRIFLSYIENECEAVALKVCDALRDRWLKNDLEAGLHRRHKERKFGPGCLEEWTRNVDALVESFYRLLQPFEQLFGQKPFLTGDRPVFADYALCGVIGLFLYPGITALPANYLMLESWYTKIRAGNFQNHLSEMQLGSGEGDGVAISGGAHAFADVADLEKALAGVKIRPGTKALDLATGHGHTALYLAARGCDVTASDVSGAMLRETAQLAKERGLVVELNEHPAEKLPYADSTFGLISCRLAAHRFQSPESFIGEAARVLKMYGHLVLIDGTVPDDQIEAYQWMNAVERLRDPDHVRFIAPDVWRKWCVTAGLTVTRCSFETFKQPDLNAYFNAANTPPENRKKMLEMVAKAPSAVREFFKIGQEDGKIVWYWRRMTLLAGKV